MCTNPDSLREGGGWECRCAQLWVVQKGLYTTPASIGRKELHLCLFYNAGEDIRVVLGKIRKDFSVNGDIFFLERADES